MQLFVKTNCPFSLRARAALDAYEVLYEEKNIGDPEAYAELMELGGKEQTPFLVDGDTMMYESQSIIEYIEQNCAGNLCAGEKPIIHFTKGEEV